MDLAQVVEAEGWNEEQVLALHAALDALEGHPGWLVLRGFMRQWRDQVVKEGLGQYRDGAGVAFNAGFHSALDQLLGIHEEFAGRAASVLDARKAQIAAADHKRAEVTRALRPVLEGGEE